MSSPRSKSSQGRRDRAKQIAPATSTEKSQARKDRAKQARKDRAKQIAPEIKRLLEDVLHLTRPKLAAELKVEKSTLAGWMAAQYPPPAEMLAKMGNLATERGHHELASLFWGWGGISDGALRDYATLRASPRSVGAPGTYVPVWLRAYRSGPDYQKTKLIHLDPSVVANPDFTFAVHAPDDAMQPIFSRGDIVVVDESRISSAAELHDGIFAAYYSPVAKEPPARKGFATPEGLYLRYGLFLGGLSPASGGMVDFVSEERVRLMQLHSVLSHARPGLKWGEVPGMEGRSFDDLLQPGPFAASDVALPPVEPGPGLQVLGRVIAWIGKSRSRQRGENQ